MGLSRKKACGFDLFDILVTFWKTLLSKPNELADKMRTIHPTKSTYAAVKEQLMRTPEVQEMIGDWGGRGYYKRKASQLDDLTLSHTTTLIIIVHMVLVF